MSENRAALVRIEDGPDDDRMTLRELMDPQTQASIDTIARRCLDCDGFIPESIKTPEQAAVAISVGLEIGLRPMAALRTLYFVHNKAGMESKAMLALLQSRPDLGYYLWDDEATDATQATIVMYVRIPGGDFVPQRYRFTMEDAKAAGVFGDMYKKWPEVMLRNRVAAIAMRNSFPGLLLGCAYTPDEIGVPVVIEGDQVVGDRAAMARGEVLALDEGDAGARHRDLAAAGLEEQDGDVDFEAAGAGASQHLDVTPDPADVAREEIRSAVADAVEQLIPPEEEPEWSQKAQADPPSTKLQVGDLVTRITPIFKGQWNRALYAYVEATGITENPDIWAAIRGWWLDGVLAAKVYDALLLAADVPVQGNPFLGGEEA